MFTLEQYPLNYAPDALAPYMSKDTVNFHYGKHLDAYMKNLNGLVVGTEYDKLALNDIVVKSATDENGKKIFNNAAQTFNHILFFASMAKDNGSKFPKKLADAFGGQEQFFDAFKTSALALFGSGWTWLAYDNGALKVINFANADTPIAHGMTPVLGLDVWEHAYYLDYQNRRGDFVDAFLNHLVDWDFVSEKLG